MKEKKYNYFHALKIDSSKCVGCAKCVRVCPTFALRIRKNKVILEEEKCVDCGKCITACNFNAIKPFSDDISKIEGFKYKVAILSTAFAGQYPASLGYKLAKKSLYKLGFDEVAEESMITEMMSDIIRDYISKNEENKPIISSSCPAIIRLIQVRFPTLLSNILRIEAPLSVLARFYREKIKEQLKIDEDQIGIFSIVPCISQVTAVHQPVGAYRKNIDGAISINDIVADALIKIDKTNMDLSDVEVYKNGLSWALYGQQEDSINDGNIKTLSVGGIKNCIDILSKIENEQLEKFDYIVMSSCTAGCVGGCLTVKNPFVSASRIRKILRTARRKNFNDSYFYDLYMSGSFNVQKVKPRNIMSLGNDTHSALKKMSAINKVYSKLPKLDCSACGSPTCKVLAEDIFDGKATLDDCTIRVFNNFLQKKETKEQNE